jgi:hypothetical protein
LCANGIRQTLLAVFERSAHRDWYCRAAAAGDLDAAGAADHFLDRATREDVAPVRLFDPAWFHARYRVNGVNSFLSYLSDPRQRLARPSPLFWPRWYARQHGMQRSPEHPFVSYLRSEREQSPHPLIDVDYLRTQAESWPNSWPEHGVALAYLADPERFRLKPHPLFDGAWYLDNNPDVARAGMNPLHHYLYFGSAENRAPNRIFNMSWYRDTYLNPNASPHADRHEPLTQYISRPTLRSPLPGLAALRRTTMTKHGPQLLIDCIEKRRNIYAAVRYRPDIPALLFQRYLAAQAYIQDLLAPVENTLLLRKNRLALMYTPKCASARIIYWWLEKVNLLSCMLRFSVSSHDALTLFRQSQEYIEDSLAFDPARFTLYKFVRNPLARAVSSFTRYLQLPNEFPIDREPGRRSISFVAFLKLVGRTDYIGGDVHIRPQRSRVEQGMLSPVILKLEDGLDRHLAALESRYDLPPARFETIPDIRKLFHLHLTQPRARRRVGPRDAVRFGDIPHMRGLLTPETAAMIYDLYKVDFDAYGYTPAIDFERAPSPGSVP